MHGMNVARLGVVVIAVAMAASSLYAQSKVSHCDASLKVDEQNPQSYRLRGDRCEGVYAQDVASTTLAIVSLTETFLEFDSAAVRSVPIRWVSPGQAPVHLRALSTPYRSYFRMDSVRPAGDAAFEWPTAVLSGRKLSSKDIGVVGTFEQLVDQKPRTIYVPLQVAPKDGAAWGATYQLRLVPGGDLSDVSWSLSRLEQDQRTLKNLIQGRKATQGLFPRGRPFVLDLQGFDQPGIYQVEVAGSSDSGKAGTSLWILHPKTR